jgi:hypothetical protein
MSVFPLCGCCEDDIGTLEGAERDVMQKLLARAVGANLESLLFFNLMIFEICRKKATDRSGDSFLALRRILA